MNPSNRSLPELIDDDDRHEEALRPHARDLARLRAEVVTTAGSEATAIVMKARADIRRVLITARCELLRLAAQIQVIPEDDERSEAAGRMLLGPAPAAREGPDQSSPSSARGRFARAAVALFGLIGLVILLGTVWWFRGTLGPATARRTAPLVAVAAGPAAALDRAGTPATGPAPVETSDSSISAARADAAPLSLLVETKRPVWIRTTIDGRSDSGRIVPAGDRQRITAAHDVSLRVGDAGAVIVSVGGAEPKAIGRDGEVVRRQFAADGAPAPSTPATLSVPPSITAHPTVTENPQSTQSRVRAPGIRAPAPSSSAGTGAPVALASSDTPEARRELAQAVQRWLDAYYRQDAAALTAVGTGGMKISDERTRAERPPPGLNQVRQTLERITFQFVGDNAIVTARLTEEANVRSETVQYVSWISQMWIHHGGGLWRLMDVRILSDSRLK